jgi:hypothetical protein
MDLGTENHNYKINMALNTFFLRAALAAALSAWLSAALAQSPVVVAKPQSWEQTAAWQEFNDYNGRFSITTPGPMTAKVDSVKTPLGTLAYHAFFFQPANDNADNAVYMVSYCDYPEGSVHSDSLGLVQDLFDATQESAAMSVNGEVRYADALNAAGYPGRIWRIDYRDGRASIHTRAFVVANRYYAVQTVCKRDMALNPSSDRFLESFRLLGRPGEADSSVGKEPLRRRKNRRNRH